MDKSKAESKVDPKNHMGNEVAPEGYVFVCLGCGKRSKDKYGDQAISHGWDVSCMLNSVLALEKDIKFLETSNHRNYKYKD